MASTAKMVKVTCDQCELLRINGVICHEHGCPNQDKRFEDGEWVSYSECFICGCDVRQGDTCSCNEPLEVYQPCEECGTEIISGWRLCEQCAAVV